MTSLALCQVINISARFARHAHIVDSDMDNDTQYKDIPQTHYELLVELFQNIYEWFIVNNDTENSIDEELLLALLSLMRSIISVNKTCALVMVGYYYSFYDVFYFIAFINVYFTV